MRMALNCVRRKEIGRLEIEVVKGNRHRVIMYFIETKATSRLPYFGHLPLNTFLSVVCIAAVSTELGGIKIHSFLKTCFK
jgi:hypothetical protein